MNIDALIATLSPEDLHCALTMLNARGLKIFEPDVTLAPEGDPYLFRWHLIPVNKDRGNVFLHIQVMSDPERPLHDHPWNNYSVILAGGYDELWWDGNPYGGMVREFRKGDTVARKAEEAHRLLMPEGITYTLTLFTTGPKVKEWGFYYPDGWHHNSRHVLDRNGRSTHVHEEGEGNGTV